MKKLTYKISEFSFCPISVVGLQRNLLQRNTFWFLERFGDPYGNRTHDSALRGLRLNRLTKGPHIQNYFTIIPYFQQFRQCFHAIIFSQYPSCIKLSNKLSVKLLSPPVSIELFLNSVIKLMTLSSNIFYTNFFSVRHDCYLQNIYFLYIDLEVCLCWFFLLLVLPLFYNLLSV